jgi:hypothetical protein
VFTNLQDNNRPFPPPHSLNVLDHAHTGSKSELTTRYACICASVAGGWDQNAVLQETACLQLSPLNDPGVITLLLDVYVLMTMNEPF